MENKIIFITGATGGIGKMTALALAGKGHTVVIHGRNISKTKAVCEELKKETGNHNIDFLTADLFLMSDVRKLAETFRQKYDRLDVLINNAGAVMDKERKVTDEGLEKTMALNLFAPFLLTELLLDSLAKSKAARIVNVASAAHKFGGKPDPEDVQLEKNYGSMRAYGLAKLYLIWNTQHLAKILKEKNLNITVNSLHPGVVATNFGKESNLGVLYNLALKLFQPFLITAGKGAETSIYLADSSDVSAITGQYFAKKKVSKVDIKYYSKENEAAVWKYCEKVTGLD